MDLLIARSEARGDLDLVARLHGLDKQQFTQLLREHPTLVDDFLSFLSNPGRAA